MPFPEVDHVVYNRNTLDQVVCQLRFPPILKINTREPDDFQERVRGELPNYAERTEFKLGIPPEIESQIAPVIMSQLPQSFSSKNHEFASRDGVSKANLTRTFIAFSTRSYTRWEDFKQNLDTPVTALVETYAPDDYSRVGLRYVNAIRRSELGLEGRAWRELIRGPVLGIVSDEEFGEAVTHAEGKFEVPLADEVSLVRIRTGFVKAGNTDETMFRIDNDFFRGGVTPADSYQDVLEYLHVRARRLFRWCITDVLHDAMEPMQP